MPLWSPSVDDDRRRRQTGIHACGALDQGAAAVLRMLVRVTLDAAGVPDD